MKQEKPRRVFTENQFFSLEKIVHVVLSVSSAQATRPNGHGTGRSK